MGRLGAIIYIYIYIAKQHLHAYLLLDSVYLVQCQACV